MSRYPLLWVRYLVAPLALMVFALTQTAFSQTTSTAPTTTSASDSSDVASHSFKESVINGLPPAIGDGLDVNLWGWLGGYRNDQHYSKSNYYDAEFAIGLTKSFNQTVAVSAQGNFIDADGYGRVELEQGFISVVLNQDCGSYITIGKFNANFGFEARDFWSRTTCTPSDLFGAQPQDLVGGMVTVPIPHTGLTLRPFISEDFQGQYDFNQSPSGGLMTEYEPAHGLDLAVTGWVGPGIVLEQGRHIQSPYDAGAYGDDFSSTLISRWQGPHLSGERAGTLGFVEAKATWQALADLRFSAEFLQGTSGTQYGRWGWFGAAGQVDYDLTDQWRIYSRLSFLDDSNWLTTGDFQRVYEYSFGTGYDLCEGVEVRGEFRHDESNEYGNADTFSIHLALTY